MVYWRWISGVASDPGLLRISWRLISAAPRSFWWFLWSLGLPIRFQVFIYGLVSIKTQFCSLRGQISLLIAPCLYCCLQGLAIWIGYPCNKAHNSQGFWRSNLLQTHSLFFSSNDEVMFVPLVLTMVAIDGFLGSPVKTTIPASPFLVPSEAEPPVYITC